MTVTDIVQECGTPRLLGGLGMRRGRSASTSWSWQVMAAGEVQPTLRVLYRCCFMLKSPPP